MNRISQHITNSLYHKNNCIIDKFVDDDGFSATVRLFKKTDNDSTYFLTNMRLYFKSFPTLRFFEY